MLAPVAALLLAPEAGGALVGAIMHQVRRAGFHALIQFVACISILFVCGGALPLGLDLVA